MGPRQMPRCLSSEILDMFASKSSARTLDAFHGRHKRRSFNNLQSICRNRPLVLSNLCPTDHTHTVRTSRAGRVALVVTLPVPNSMLQYLMPWRSRSGTKPPRAYGSPIIFRVSSPPAAIVARVFSVPPEAVLAEMKCQMKAENAIKHHEASHK